MPPEANFSQNFESNEPKKSLQEEKTMKILKKIREIDSLEEFKKLHFLPIGISEYRASHSQPNDKNESMATGLLPLSNAIREKIKMCFDEIGIQVDLQNILKVQLLESTTGEPLILEIFYINKKTREDMEIVMLYRE